MLSATTETYVAWVTWLLFLGAGLTALAGLLTLGGARRMRYFQVRREAVLQGWGRLVASLILFIAALMAMGFGAPALRLALPATPTRAPSPTARASPVAPGLTAAAQAAATQPETATSTNSPGPSPTTTNSPTPTTSPTPALPSAFITPILTATVTPPPQASAVNVRFALKDDCTVPTSQGFFDQTPKQIFAHFYYDSWLPGVQWSGVWLRDGVVVFSETHLWDGSTGGCGYSNYDNGKNWWSEGNYEVQIFVGSRWLVSGQFQVTRTAPTATTTATRTPLPPSATLSPTVSPTARDTQAPTATLTPTFTGTPTLGPGSPSPTRTQLPTATGTPSRTPRPPTAAPSLTSAPATATATIYPYGVAALATISLPSNITTGVLRATAPDGLVVAFVQTGDPVEVLTNQQMIQGIIWRQVRLANGDQGWIQQFLLKILPLP